MEEEVLNEVKTFFIRDLSEYELSSSDNDKRLKLIGKIDILLTKIKDASLQRAQQEYEPLISRSSYERSNRASSDTNVYDDEINSIDEYSATSKPINIPHGGRRQDEPEQRVTSAYSSMNLAEQPEAQVRHTGRVTLVSGKLPKPVSGNISYFAFLLTDRLVLFKRLKDTEPAHDITITGASLCSTFSKSTFRLYCTSAGKMKSYCFMCKTSSELLTWVEIINEVIKNRQQTSPAPMYADHPNWNRRFSASDSSRRQKSKKYSPFNFFRNKSSRETISHPLPSPLNATSPLFPRGTEEGSDTFEGSLKLLYPNGDSLLRYCMVSNGFFSVYLSAETKSQVEFQFPLQCCELDLDREAIGTNRLSFRIVQGCVIKVSCEALDQVSHFQWLKCLVQATQRSTTVPHQLLNNSPPTDGTPPALPPPRVPRRDVTPLPDDGELDDYQVPITTKALPREKISDFRQTVMSIHQSFCDYDITTGQDDIASLHRSEQELHQPSSAHSAAEVRRSWSTRPLYARGDRQLLCCKVERRLLPDIERFIDESSEKWRRRRSGSAPILSVASSSNAVYVEATPMQGSKRESNRSSSTNYASERNTDDSSGLGFECSGCDLLVCEKYKRHNFSPRREATSDGSLQENIYEPVELTQPSRPPPTSATTTTTYVSMDYHNDSGIDQEEGPVPKPRGELDSGPIPGPKPTAKPRSLSFNAAAPVRKDPKKKEEMDDGEEEVTNLDDLPPGHGAQVEGDYDELPKAAPGPAKAATLNGGSAEIKRYQKPALPPKPPGLQRRHTKNGERHSASASEPFSARRSGATPQEFAAVKAAREEEEEPIYNIPSASERPPPVPPPSATASPASSPVNNTCLLSMAAFATPPLPTKWRAVVPKDPGLKSPSTAACFNSKALPDISAHRPRGYSLPTFVQIPTSDKCPPRVLMTSRRGKSEGQKPTEQVPPAVDRARVRWLKAKPKSPKETN